MNTISDDPQSPSAPSHEDQGDSCWHRLRESTMWSCCRKYWEALLGVFGIFMYLFDIGSDVFVAYTHFSDKNLWYFRLTVGFVVFPSLTIMIYSLVRYKKDAEKANQQPTTANVLRIVLHVLQLGPVVRYFDVIRYGRRSRKEGDKSRAREWYRKKVDEDKRASRIRLVEGCLEAAPQLTLQLYIFLVDGFSKNIYFAVVQCVSCVSSLASIAWAMTASYSADRLASSKKANMTKNAKAVMFFWHLFGVAARVLALALFTSMYTVIVIAVIAVHVFAMFCLAKCLKRDNCSCSCNCSCSEVVSLVFSALLSTFDYFNEMKGHTKLKYIVFYALVVIEYIAMLLVYCFVDSLQKFFWSRYAILVLTIVVLLFHAVAVVFQVLYYRQFHPNITSRKNGQSRYPPPDQDSESRL